eukprot:4376936-Pyramimonas_sp.AAC.1
MGAVGWDADQFAIDGSPLEGDVVELPRGVVRRAGIPARGEVGARALASEHHHTGHEVRGGG